jgi:hypothetical protein
MMIVTRRQLAVVGIAVVLIAAGLAGYFLTRPQPTDEQKIVALIAQGQRAVERRNSTGLTRLISKAYDDPYGYNREQLVGQIVGWMRSGQEMQVVPEIVDLQFNGDFADVKLRVWMAWGQGAAAGGEPFRMTVRLRREGRTWRVISAEGWGEAQSDIMSGE